jgi:hypothetical protein
MSVKERQQNPVVGDTVNLRLVTYNSNNPSDVNSITSVDIYALECNTTCKDGRRLVESIDGSLVQHTDVGTYLLPLTTAAPEYVSTKYQDVWNVVFASGDVAAEINNNFQLYSDLWYTSVTPAVYSFDFRFQPNRIRKGSKKWLIIQILPNVPRATDIERYYTNLAISANLLISIELNCGPCVPPEEDLRLIVDSAPVDVRDKVFGYYFLDTTDMDCGIYNVWFELDYAGNVDLSTKQQIQIY